MSSEAEENVEANESEDDVASAGMEITVQGSYLRPLQFFLGQGELMGHIWSGTAAEPTPAYVANSLFHDHYEVRQLHNGASVMVDVKSVLSVDLNGAIQMSLWNRNAQTQVYQKSVLSNHSVQIGEEINQFCLFSVGLVIRGSILLNAGFLSLDLQFGVEKEPKLVLNADSDFSDENLLCMQLRQPEDVFM